MLIDRGAIVRERRPLDGQRDDRRDRDPGDPPRPAARPHRPAARRREAEPAGSLGDRPPVPGPRPRARTLPTRSDQRYDDADLQLDTLEARGLIRLAPLQPELEYLFRHALVQDTAYGSLLKQERRVLHQVGRRGARGALSRARGELAAVLALHFEQAGDSEKAIDYLSKPPDSRSTATRSWRPTTFTHAHPPFSLAAGERA